MTQELCMSKKSVMRAMFGTMAAVCLAGCANTSNYPGHSEVANDITPDILSLSKRPIDANNTMRLTNNENYRMMWDDLGRLSLLNRPSRLSPYPMPR
jgi:uncharacterized lipoprotein YajG